MICDREATTVTEPQSIWNILERTMSLSESISLGKMITGVNVNNRGAHKQKSWCWWHSVSASFVDFISCKRRKNKNKKNKKWREHLNCWAPITLKHPDEVTMVINVVVEPRGSETKWSGPAVLMGYLWWLRVGLRVVTDRWPHWVPGALLRTLREKKKSQKIHKTSEKTPQVKLLTEYAP